MSHKNHNRPSLIEKAVLAVGGKVSNDILEAQARQKTLMNEHEKAAKLFGKFAHKEEKKERMDKAGEARVEQARELVKLGKGNEAVLAYDLAIRDFKDYGNQEREAEVRLEFVEVLRNLGNEKRMRMQYKVAGNEYAGLAFYKKRVGKLIEAADMFGKSGDAFEKAGFQSNAVLAYIQQAECYRLCIPKLEKAAFVRAHDIYGEMVGAKGWRIPDDEKLRVAEAIDKYAKRKMSDRAA